MPERWMVWVAFGLALMGFAVCGYLGGGLKIGIYIFSVGVLIMGCVMAVVRTLDD